MVFFSLKFQVLHQRRSDIASFVKQPVYSIWKMYSVLILVFLILICHYSPKEHVQKSLFLKFEFLREISSFIASFVEPLIIAFSIYKMSTFQFFYFNALQLIQSACGKKNFFSLKFQMLRERSSDIASLVKHPVYSICKRYSVLILVFLILISHYSPKKHV